MPACSTKKSLRSYISQVRLQMNIGSVSEKSSIIRKLLFSTPEYKNSKTIMLYHAFKNEVDTTDIIKDALKTKKVVLPSINSVTNKIILYTISGLDELSSGEYGIMEPKNNPKGKVSQEDVDLCIVPGIAFDRTGARIGYGKGYYDRLLSGTHFQKIALAYDFQLVEKIQTEPHDAAVDMIITEKDIIRCKNNLSAMQQM
jgi:5-formyltetrahydrofolate cyclo-ligase